MKLINGKPIKRVNIIGCPFDAVSLDDTVSCIKEAVINQSTLRISVGNIDMVMKARKNPKFADVFSSADLIIADGVPILWAARLIGDPLHGRVAGTEIVWKCGKVSAETGCKVGLIGGSYETALRAAENIRERYSDANLHVFSTPFPLTPENNKKLVKEVKKERIGIILVALGAPKQEYWIKEHVMEIGANVGIGIGSAFDIISGEKPWAPLWMRENGLEWLHRMKLEPKRFAKRYLIEDMPFFWYLLVDIIRKKIWRNRV